MNSKNIHILPTDKPSRLFIDVDDNKLKICVPLGGEHMMNQNIYITNDEEIKEGDYYIDFTSDGLKIEHFKTKDDWVLVGICDSKKIILTDNKDLIKNGIQAIDDEFLEWFVKNPSCERVEVNDWLDNNGNIAFGGDIRYQIIIPQEEPKSNCPKCRTTDFDNCHSIQCPMRKKEPLQETLEDAAEYYVKMQYPMGVEKEYPIADFKAGAEWKAERMYSEEEVYNLLYKLLPDKEELNEWFEQYKKK